MTFKRPVTHDGTCVIDAERNVIAHTYEEYVAARIADALTNYAGAETARPEGRTINVEGRDFYELCQAYRHSKERPEHPSLPNTVEAFEALKKYIATGELPWLSYDEPR